MKWDSFVPKIYKKGLVNSLVFSAPHMFCFTVKLCLIKFTRQVRRLIAKIALCVELRLLFRAAQKLSFLTRLKSKLNVSSWSGVVYQISCSQCEAFYVSKS